MLHGSENSYLPFFNFQLMPTPKWKLVVDVGSAPPKPDDAKATDKRVQDVLKLLAEHTPTHRNSPYSPYLPGFTSLRLVLLKRNRTKEDDDVLSTMLESYSSYLASGKEPSEIAWMMARDYMLLTQPTSQICGSTMAPSMQSFQHASNQLQQVLQPQLGQLQGNVNSHVNQFQPQQMQQLGALQHASHFQMGTSPVPFGAGLNPSFMGAPSAVGANALSALGHLAPHAGANGANGMAALTHLVRQQQQHNGIGNTNNNNSTFPNPAMSQPKGQEK